MGRAGRREERRRGCRGGESAMDLVVNGVPTRFPEGDLPPRHGQSSFSEEGSAWGS